MQQSLLQYFILWYGVSDMHLNGIHNKYDKEYDRIYGVSDMHLNGIHNSQLFGDSEHSGVSDMHLNGIHNKRSMTAFLLLVYLICI